MSYNIIAFQPRGLEFADFPLQRNGPLYGQTLYIDIRDMGTRSDGSTWIGTPLADASGAVGLIQQNISQLMTVAGKVTELQVLKKREHAVDASIRDTFHAAMPGVQNTTDARRRMKFS